MTRRARDSTATRDGSPAYSTATRDGSHSHQWLAASRRRPWGLCWRRQGSKALWRRCLISLHLDFRAQPQPKRTVRNHTPQHVVSRAAHSLRVATEGVSVEKACILEFPVTACPRCRHPMSARDVGPLLVAYFMNEVGAEYGLLSQTHYEMIYNRLMAGERRKRKRRRENEPLVLEDAEAKRRQAGVASAGELAEVGEAVDEEEEEKDLAEAVGLRTTKTLVAQSTLSAVLEFCGAALAGHLADSIGRRPVNCRATPEAAAAAVAPPRRRRRRRQRLPATVALCSSFSSYFAAGAGAEELGGAGAAGCIAASAGDQAGTGPAPVGRVCLDRQVRW